MQTRLLLNSNNFEITLNRLCHQLIENHDRFENSVIIGLQPRGIFVAQRIQKILEKTLPGAKIHCGFLDITFHRDDYRRREVVLPNSTKIDFIIENKKVILMDDVLFTGRTIRAGMDAMLAFGRPEKVELLVLVDRRYNRHLPIAPDYTGITVDTITTQKVKVQWNETDGNDAVLLQE